MYRKYRITGAIEVVTGLHIGGSTQYSPIGSVDAPVIRDSLTNEPIIPGSSLKGKMRTLLAISKNTNKILQKPVFDSLQIKKLFGASRPNNDDKNKNRELEDRVIPARLQFRDMKVKNREILERERFLDSLTEVKFENTINRSTGAATPRQIERVVPGVEFGLDIIYNAIFCEKESKENEIQHEILDDFQLLNDGFRLLQYDYLGGNGSRGHGKIKFKKIEVECVYDSEQREHERKDSFTDELEKMLNVKLDDE